MPRFVILKHERKETHWDLMLEVGPALRTWALQERPDRNAPIEARPLADHRTAYLEYEGPVGRHRGSVQRWDRGTFEFLHQDTDGVEVALRGERLEGTFRLERGTAHWTFRHLADQSS